MKYKTILLLLGVVIVLYFTGCEETKDRSDFATGVDRVNSEVEMQVEKQEDSWPVDSDAPVITVNPGPGRHEKFKKKYLRLITSFQEPFSAHEQPEIEKFYRENIRLPENIKNLDIEMSEFARFDHTDSHDFQAPYVYHMGMYTYNELGYVSTDGDMWFTGTQSDTHAMLVNRTGITHLEGGVETQPNSGRVIFFEEVWSTKVEVIEGRYIYAVVGDEMRFMWDEKQVLPREPVFGDGGAIFKGQRWFDVPIRVHYLDRYIGKDWAFINYDIFTKEKRTYIFPFTVCYIDFSAFSIEPNQTDSSGRCYFSYNFTNEEDFVVEESSVFIIDAQKDTLYQLRHPIFFDEAVESPLTAHYVIGEDDNLYFQLVTDEHYIIYKIVPAWERPMEDAQYNPFCFDVYPELNKMWEGFE
jgi:hypothetical protein